jgi:hypothetical protein
MWKEHECRVSDDTPAEAAGKNVSAKIFAPNVKEGPVSRRLELLH